MATRIICLGNELACDDGIGIRVGRILRDLDLPNDVSVELRPRIDLDLLDSLHSDDLLVLVDAMRANHKPGECRVIYFADAVLQPQSQPCCHGLGIAEVFAIARKLMPEKMPRDLMVIGIEAEILDQFGVTLSNQVRNAIPRAVEMTLQSIGANHNLLQMGLCEAQKRLDWTPSPTEAFGG